MFAAWISLYPPDNREIDIDNRVKAILDMAQMVGVIKNDKKCRLLIVKYGNPKPGGGAKLVLRPMYYRDE